MNYARRRIFTKVIKAFDRRAVQAYSNISDTYLLWSIQLLFKNQIWCIWSRIPFFKTKSSCMPLKYKSLNWCEFWRVLLSYVDKIIYLSC